MTAPNYAISLRRGLEALQSSMTIQHALDGILLEISRDLGPLHPGLSLVSDTEDPKRPSGHLTIPLLFREGSRQVPFLVVHFSPQGGYPLRFVRGSYDITVKDLFAVRRGLASMMERPDVARAILDLTRAPIGGILHP